MRHRFVAAEEDRLDRAIAAATPLSRKRARKLVESGAVRVDGHKARHSSQKVDAGAVVEVRSSAPAGDKVPDLPERYRDADIVVVDKPSGLPSQGTKDGGRMHVHGILAARERYAGLHHRLDRPASGLMLLTLRKTANVGVADAFASGNIHRDYLAVVLGDPGPQGAWTGPIDDQEATTHWRRLGADGGAAVLLCTLETGRTHQIRRHAADAGHPILGDRRYGGAAGRAWDRLALHACRLAFPHPRTGVEVEVRSPVPDDLRDLVEEAGYSEPDGELDDGELDDGDLDDGDLDGGIG